MRRVVANPKVAHRLAQLGSRRLHHKTRRHARQPGPHHEEREPVDHQAPAQLAQGHPFVARAHGRMRGGGGDRAGQGGEQPIPPPRGPPQTVTRPAGSSCRAAAVAFLSESGLEAPVGEGFTDLAHACLEVRVHEAGHAPSAEGLVGAAHAAQIARQHLEAGEQFRVPVGLVHEVPSEGPDAVGACVAAVGRHHQTHQPRHLRLLQPRQQVAVQRLG
mmetsp:Transcript_51007/g.115961  ORF Transcript_51007/g.115961 Transcript_51007/m.115961 type:complete len:217 (+) Transcript_51007:489-1139(+)